MTILYLVFSYLLGTCMTAWFVGKLYGVSLQERNSGNLGARNAGKTLGKSAFIITAVVDGLKGLIVVVVGRYFEFSDTAIAVAIVFVLLGHLYPFWLKFKGGKGVATIIGALLVFNPLYFCVFLIGFLVTMIATKSLTWGMLGGFIVYSVYVLLFNTMDWPIICSVVLVLWRHRQNFRERLT
ncbi:glycerol-3-phosphate acyltransferase [Solibacillus sp. CAU 1738]|uniref:glycerol-3-phosphate acyltransferase n=1 Tax=Solibacillus sp. CAU 1738 TaxID=3140363 RepID=UPI00326140B2